MLQLLGFIPYTLTLLRTAVEKKYYSVLGLAAVLLLVVVYWPEMLLLYLLVLAASGLTKTLVLSGPGLYTLVGNFPTLSFLSVFHPLLLSLGAVGTVGTLYSARGKMPPASTIAFTALACLSLLSFATL